MINYSSSCFKLFNGFRGCQSLPILGEQTEAIVCTQRAFYLVLLLVSKYLLNKFPFAFFSNLCAFTSLQKWQNDFCLFVYFLEWPTYYEFLYVISSLDGLSVVLICADMVFETLRIDMVWRFDINIPAWWVTITRFSISVLWFFPH